MNYVENFKEYLIHDRRVSYQTVNGYAYCITKFIEFANCNPTIVTTDDIRDMFKHLSTKGLRNSSISNYISALRSFYNWLYYINKTKEAQDISFYLNKIVRSVVDYKDPVVPTTKEIDILRRAMHAYKTAFEFNKEISEYAYILRDLAVVEMMIATGARSNEIKHMCLKDLDLENGTVIIRKGKGNKQRTSIFGDSAKVTVQEYVSVWNLGAEERLFFFTKFDVLRSIVKRWAHKAGINPNLYPHSFRHYHITKAQRDGVPAVSVAHQVGHRNLNTTMRYTHLDHEHRREIYKISDLQK